VCVSGNCTAGPLDRFAPEMGGDDGASISTLYYTAHAPRLSPAMSVSPAKRSDLFRWRPQLGTRSPRIFATRGLVPLLGALLIVRVLFDDRSSPDSHHTGSLNLSGGIAALLIVVAVGLLLRRRHGLWAAILTSLWLCVWTAIAVSTRGASTETLREGVREASVVALAVIVYNARGAVTVPVATRLVQFMGVIPALLALYQLVTNTGVDIHGEIRSNGTFAHPDSAAMFFAIATVASMWRYLDNGRHRSDVLLVAVFAAALVSTLSIDGLATLVAMLVVLGVLRGGSFRIKVAPYLVAILVISAFFATPLGAQRVVDESSTSLATAERGEANTSLDWRLHKWKTLLPEWEASPIFGQGLGTTITTEAVPGNRFAGKPPHNEYVRYLVETGIIGLSILLGAVTILVRSLARRRRTPGTLDTGTLNAPTLAIAIIVGCLVNSLADNTLIYSPTGYAAALIVVAVLSMTRYRHEATSTVEHAGALGDR
jgi:O-antigen ligase